MIQENYTSDEFETDYDDEPPKFHYIRIKRLSRLLSGQVSKSKQHICERCLYYFRTKGQLSSHERNCKEINKCRVKLPIWKDKIKKFKNYNKKERVLFIVYADFESLVKNTKNGSCCMVCSATETIS